MIRVVLQGSRFVQAHYGRGDKVLISMNLLASCTQSVNDKLKSSLINKIVYVYGVFTSKVFKLLHDLHKGFVLQCCSF